MSIIYGGLDVHKSSISVCLLHSGTGEVISQQLPNDQQHVLRAARRWAQLGEARLCYEASGAGFVLQRWLQAAGLSCEVIAPSLIPKAPGDRVKTDKRDARKLATLYRAGLLATVRVPAEGEETVRALVRLHGQLTVDCTRVKNRLHKYLRTLGQVYPEQSYWTVKHRAWLAGLALDDLQQLIVRTHLDELDTLLGQRQQVERRIAALAQTEPYREGVGRLLSLRGVGTLTAMVLLTEIGDARRFASAPQLMAYLGLVPREESSGESRHTGSITKAGNHHVRRVLVETAWNQTRKPGSCRRLSRHWQSQPAAVVAIARKAERRLYEKFWKVSLRKDPKTAAVAVARELAGFIWALLRLEGA
jgi:transposase